MQQMRTLIMVGFSTWIIRMLTSSWVERGRLFLSLDLSWLKPPVLITRMSLCMTRKSTQTKQLHRWTNSGVEDAVTSDLAAAVADLHRRSDLGEGPLIYFHVENLLSFALLPKERQRRPWRLLKKTDPAHQGFEEGTLKRHRSSSTLWPSIIDCQTSKTKNGNLPL